MATLFLSLRRTLLALPGFEPLSLVLRDGLRTANLDSLGFTETDTRALAPA